jgi:hypothetical protein
MSDFNFGIGDIVFLKSDWWRELPMTVVAINEPEDDSEIMIECGYIDRNDYNTPRLSTFCLNSSSLIISTEEDIEKHLKSPYHY